VFTDVLLIEDVPETTSRSESFTMRLDLFIPFIALLRLSAAQDDEDPEPTPTPTPTPTPGPIDTFANVTVYQPNSPSTQVTYARTENLPNNTILSVFSDDSVTGTLSIYQSKDNGFSWYAFGTVTSEVASRRLMQPHLLYTNETFGDFDGGVVLLAVNAMDVNSTNVELYASGDFGETWEYLSSIASGNETSKVGEPFLVVQ
jgi:hypothetical protein